MRIQIIGLIAGAILTVIIAAKCETTNRVNAVHTNLTHAQERFFRSNWLFYGASTNGLACALRIRNDWPFQDGQLLPACLICVTNNTTDLLRGYLNMPATNLLSIELLDLQGKPVKKTAMGKMFGKPLTQKQIEKWADDKRWAIKRHGKFFEIYPSTIPANTQICSFSIPEAFKINKPGEYELHLRLRLIKMSTDSSGKFYYPVTWLPEVTAKIQIRAEDIPKTNSVSSGQ